MRANPRCNASTPAFRPGSTGRRVPQSPGNAPHPHRQTVPRPRAPRPDVPAHSHRPPSPRGPAPSRSPDPPPSDVLPSMSGTPVPRADRTAPGRPRGIPEPLGPVHTPPLPRSPRPPGRSYPGSPRRSRCGPASARSGIHGAGAVVQSTAPRCTSGRSRRSDKDGGVPEWSRSSGPMLRELRPQLNVWMRRCGIVSCFRILQTAPVRIHRVRECAFPSGSGRRGEDLALPG